MTRKAWIAFASISLIWGVPYLLIRIAVRRGVPPGTLAWARVALAAALLLALAWRAGGPGWPRGRRGAGGARRGARPAPRGPERRSDRRCRGARAAVHRGRVRDLHGADPRGGHQPRDRDHLRQSGDRRRTRRLAAR